MIKKIDWRLGLNGILAMFYFFLKKKSGYHKLFILHKAKILQGAKYNKKMWLSALNEIENFDLVPLNDLEKQGSKFRGNSIDTLLGKWIYCIIRVCKPKVVIETGVAHGFSSWCILNALNKNEYGKLFSIDLPSKDTDFNYNINNYGVDPGWLVPKELKSKWKLMLGDTKDLLPSVLDELKKVDIFFHDSDHSYENMKFEFETVLPYVSKNGYIISDDIDKNSAFEEFVYKNNLLSFVFRSKGGTISINQSNR